MGPVSGARRVHIHGERRLEMRTYAKEFLLAGIGLLFLIPASMILIEQEMSFFIPLGVVMWIGLIYRLFLDRDKGGGKDA